MTFNVGNEVALTKERIGIIRYKGPLDGKTGVYYGVEISKGKGKHSGVFKGKRYFMCQKGRGLFVDKKQILYKLEPNDKDKRKQQKDTERLIKIQEKERRVFVFYILFTQISIISLYFV